MKIRDNKPWDKTVSEETRANFFKAQQEAREKATIHPDFEMVLTDLMMPAEKSGQDSTGLRLLNTAVPYGFAIALLALKSGAKKVAIVSNGQADDGNHHNHPILWACDSIGGAILEGRPYGFVGYSCPHMSEKTLPGVENPYYIKDWATVLKGISDENAEATTN